MPQQELTPQTYKRIHIITWLLSVPLIVLFSWPYLYVANAIEVEQFLRYIGSFLFSIPFTITILHGYVTMTLGEAHRHHYYNWLVKHPLTYGLLFHPVIIRTRFRLVLLTISFLLLIVGTFFKL
jgi:hypothetical protein